MDSTYRFSLFGVPTLFDAAGREIPLRTRKQYALLTVLIVEGQERPVPRDRLTELIWPEVSGERGRHSLSQAVTELRGRVDSTLFSRGGDTLRLERRIVTELDEIAAGGVPAGLQAPLIGADGWVGPAFAHWADAAREHCLRKACDALREAIRQLRRQGKLGRTHEVADALYALDPLSDVAVHALAERLLVRGDVVGAIRLLREHTERVREEVGCDPQPDVTRLLRRLEAGDPSVDTVPVQLVAEARRLRPPEFVGREEELALLEAEWDTARGGQFRSILVQGPGGIGKSSLLRRFATGLAARAHLTFRVSAEEIGARIPFATISDLVATVARNPNAGATSPEWMAEASRICPELRTLYAGIPQPLPMPPEATRLRFGEATAQLLIAVMDSEPALIALDDIQNADPASREVLFLLERRLRDLPVLLVSTVRSESGNDARPSHTHGLQWHRAIELKRLPATLTRELAIRLLPTDAPDRLRIAGKIADLAQGNPHFVEILAADWTKSGGESLVASELRNRPPDRHVRSPLTFRAAFARTYHEAHDRNRQIINVLAVAKRALLPKEISSALSCSGESIRIALIELVENGILRFDHGRVRTQNELHRAYAYYAMSPDLRRYYHVQLGQALRELDTNATDLRLVEAGTHLWLGGVRAEARELIVRGSRQAIRLGAPQEAEVALRMVQESLEDPESAVLLAEALSAQGKYAAVTKHCASALDGQGLSPLGLATLAVIQLEASQRSRLQPEPVLRQMAQTVNTALELCNDVRLTLRSLQTNAEMVSESGCDDELLRIEESAMKLAGEVSASEHRGRALMTAGYCRLVRQDSSLAERYFRESLSCFQMRGFEPERARVLNGLGGVLFAQGKLLEGFGEFERAAEIATGLRDVGHLATIWANMGVGHEWLGDPTSATRCYELAAAFNARDPTPRRTVAIALNRFDLAVMLRNSTDAREALEVARRCAQETGSELLADRVRLAEADYLLFTGEPECAWSLTEAVLVGASSKAPAVEDRARAARLRMLLDHAVGTHPQATKRDSGYRVKSLPQRIEIWASREWTEHGGKTKADHRLGKALRLARRYGLIGVIVRLTALGVFPDGLEIERHASANAILKHLREGVRLQTPTPSASPHL